MTLNPYNIQELEDVISIARENGAIRFAVGMTVGLGRALGKDLLLTKEQITKANDRLGELAKKYATQEFSVAPWIGRFNSEPVLEESKNISCGAGNRFCFIDCMGNVKPCGMMDLIAGNVSQKTITDICRSPLISSLSEIKCPSKKICGNCENLYFCDGCIANAILKSKETKLCAWLPHWIKYNNAMSI
jgi:radical SAM protein with 4Fe4S-binding SPASM domain